jgi:hypothetical protein
MGRYPRIILEPEPEDASLWIIPVLIVKLKSNKISSMMQDTYPSLMQTDSVYPLD